MDPFLTPDYPDYVAPSSSTSPAPRQSARKVLKSGGKFVKAGAKKVVRARGPGGRGFAAKKVEKEVEAGDTSAASGSGMESELLDSTGRREVAEDVNAGGEAGSRSEDTRSSATGTQSAATGRTNEPTPSDSGIPASSEIDGFGPVGSPLPIKDTSPTASSGSSSTPDAARASSAITSKASPMNGDGAGVKLDDANVGLPGGDDDGDEVGVVGQGDTGGSDEGGDAPSDGKGRVGSTMSKAGGSDERVGGRVNGVGLKGGSEPEGLQGNNHPG